MANTFKVVTFAAEPNSAGTPYTVYTVYGVPAELGSAAKVTTLKVFAIYYLLFTYILYCYFKKSQ